MPLSYFQLDNEKKAQVGSKKGRSRKKVFIVFSLLLACLLIGFFSYVGFSVKSLASDFSTLLDQGKRVEIAVKKQDINMAKNELKVLNTHLLKTKGDLGRIGFFQHLPFFKSYYQDVVHAVNAAILASRAGEMITDSALPFADSLSLTSKESKIRTDQKIQILATKVFPTLSERVDEFTTILEDIEKEIDQIREERYPQNLTINKTNVRKTISEGKKIIGDIKKVLPFLKDILEVTPEIFAYNREKAYLLWLQNDKEIRATGGFLTAYAIAKIRNGKLVSVQSDDIYNLDKKFTPFEKAPPLYTKYMVVADWYPRDANSNPDFKLSAQKFESFYNRISGMPKIDGIIAIDTEVLLRLLEITGPIELKKYKEVFSTNLNQKYQVADAIYKLEYYAEKVHAGDPERKGIIGDLMDAVMERLFSLPSDKMLLLFETFRDLAEEKSVQFYFHDQKAQKLAEWLGFAGRMKDYKGDFLHINNSNLAGLKGNLFTKSEVGIDINISADGTVTKKVSLNIKNTFKADGWLNSVYQNWTRVYVPEGSRLIDKKVFSDFKERKEFGYTRFETFFRVAPLKENDIFFTYELPFRVKKGQTYKMFLQAQGGSLDPYVSITVNGKLLKQFDLKKDTEIEFLV